MADNQITPFRLTDQFTMDNFNQRINETNTALQNKIHGPVTALRTHDEVDNAKSIGFYTFYGFDNGKYWSIFGQEAGTIFVMPLRLGYEQFFFPQSNDFVARRLWKGSDTGWGSWEVFNPPMVIGVEYRTTERYLGKPVYIVLCECDNFLSPGSTGSFFATSKGVKISNAAFVVDFGGQVDSSWYIPTFLYGGNFSDSNIVQIEARVDSAKNIVIYTYTKTRDLTAKKPLVWVKYTKTTD